MDLLFYKATKKIVFLHLQHGNGGGTLRQTQKPTMTIYYFYLDKKNEVTYFPKLL